MVIRGQQICVSLVGLISQKNSRKMATPINPVKMVPDLRSILFLIIPFASFTKHFKVASHNLHGFNNSSVFHKQCIQNYGGICMAQELWLPENRLSCLQELGVNFTAHSGMEDAVSSGILRGGPYGGVSIAWSPDMNHLIKPLVNHQA